MTDPPTTRFIMRKLLFTAVAVGLGMAVAKPLRRAASQAFLHATGTVVRDERPAAGGR
ncbi:hypothetical protein [Actinoallomurus sp. CA-142502]|uniref:hypothetical protein n=1 Tax=Actinoallomurus sp. CA-142502 TaxID=3239885 RepID=UPI003D901376